MLLTPRQAQFAFVPSMVTVMSAVISFAMTTIHHGFAPGLLQAWLRNLTDVEYRTHQVETAGGHFVQDGPPRQAGLTLNVKF